MIVVLLATISSIFLYINRKFKGQTRPPFTTVRTNDRKLLSENERKVFDLLTGEGYYVSCKVPFGIAVLPIALIPFRCAVYPRKNVIQVAVISIYLSLKGWKVFFLTEKKGQKDILETVGKIQTLLQKEISSYKVEEPKEEIQ